MWVTRGGVTATILHRTGRGLSHIGRNRTETGANADGTMLLGAAMAAVLRSPWGAATPSLASLLFAVALVCANGAFLVTAVLPAVSAIRAPVHPLGLGDPERAVS
jgi:hypothetical protein